MIYFILGEAHSGCHLQNVVQVARPVRTLLQGSSGSPGAWTREVGEQMGRNGGTLGVFWR